MQRKDVCLRMAGCKGREENRDVVPLHDTYPLVLSCGWDVSMYRVYTLHKRNKYIIQQTICGCFAHPEHGRINNR